jgi:hypothetical protein
MMLPITPVPAYPNVPNAPGVPPILRQVGAVQSTVVALAADAVTILSLFQGPQWGLFNADGSPVFGGPTSSSLLNNLASGIGLSSQSVLEMEFSQDYAISTAPQEQGAFVSYNKVSRPYTARVSYTVGGLAATRTAFLQAAQALVASLALLTLATPEFSYANCNAVHYDYRRMNRAGVTLIVVDIWVEQVRVTQAAAFSNSNTASPDAASQTNGGTVQATPDTNPNSVAGPAT